MMDLAADAISVDRFWAFTRRTAEDFIRLRSSAQVSYGSHRATGHLSWVANDTMPMRRGNRPAWHYGRLANTLYTVAVRHRTNTAFRAACGAKARDQCPPFLCRSSPTRS
jgi:hypothetical protein